MPVAADAAIECLLAGLVDKPAGVVLNQSHNAPELALAHSALLGKELLAQCVGLRPNLFGLPKQGFSLTRRIKEAFSLGQCKAAWALRPMVSAQEHLGVHVSDL